MNGPGISELTWLGLLPQLRQWLDLDIYFLPDLFEPISWSETTYIALCLLLCSAYSQAYQWRIIQLPCWMVHLDVASASILSAKEDSTRLRASLIRDETTHEKLNSELTEHKVRHDQSSSRSGTLHEISLGVDEIVDDTDRWFISDLLVWHGRAWLIDSH